MQRLHKINCSEGEKKLREQTLKQLNTFLYTEDCRCVCRFMFEITTTCIGLKNDEKKIEDNIMIHRTIMQLQCLFQTTTGLTSIQLVNKKLNKCELHKSFWKCPAWSNLTNELILNDRQITALKGHLATPIAACANTNWQVNKCYWTRQISIFQSTSPFFHEQSVQ